MTLDAFSSCAESGDDVARVAAAVKALTKTYLRSAVVAPARRPFVTLPDREVFRMPILGHLHWAALRFWALNFGAANVPGLSSRRRGFTGDAVADRRGAGLPKEDHCWLWGERAGYLGA